MLPLEEVHKTNLKSRFEFEHSKLIEMVAVGNSTENLSRKILSASSWFKKSSNSAVLEGVISHLAEHVPNSPSPHDVVACFAYHPFTTYPDRYISIALYLFVSYILYIRMCV